MRVQELIARYAWGENLDASGLPEKTRSLTTIAMMVALNRTMSCALHLPRLLTPAYPGKKLQECAAGRRIYIAGSRC